ncbi:MAG: bifunctional glutamate N-acetyltransferase/amino-acid acetyltransferase ArgJ [Elusimicrobia bacterium]|nr:bifunctional glutamate N-acetyltransferase/amino-acid acetyltransferase ArgJ [Elusimicrobiota bacterium]
MGATVPLKNSDLPAGFQLRGLRCGISSVPGKKDLALFLSDRPARAAGVFTKNLFAAAPVLYGRKKLAASPNARAVIINSGCANACTGKQGAADTAWTAKELAHRLDLKSSDVLVASTGVIGRHLPRPALGRGLREIAALVRKGASSSAEDAVRAIMTTDTRPKAARSTFVAGGATFTVWGCAKGAGMIHPDMATMLSVVLTDAGLPAPFLQKALSDAARRTFNCVSVDGDTSTNDSLFLLANGAAGTLRPSDAKALKAFRSALEDVCLSLSTQIAADGEGATRVAWIFVQGARTEKDAHRLAATVATSALFKTALHGADPNWGRILAALGRAGVPLDPNRVDVSIGDVPVCRKGGKADYSEKAVHGILKKDRVTIVVDLHQGKAWSRYATCDYSKDYIAINADYTT